MPNNKYEFQYHCENCSGLNPILTLNEVNLGKH